MKTPRDLMELAIKVMRQSRAEPRTDGKTSPKVGAVLVWPDGRTETASRGELREGDHAEFTLLERKNRHRALDGCTLFATLEPCAPDSRRHPKLPCAERIVLARIREVWVGIEDPDPTVDRKGIKFLQASGVTVHMFDRDLQEVIREDNADFLAQALGGPLPRASPSSISASRPWRAYRSSPRSKISRSRPSTPFAIAPGLGRGRTPAIFIASWPGLAC